jgi:hypothetical protein
MQMDAYLKKEQIGTLFVWVGALEGGFGGGVLRGVHPKKYTCRPKKNTLLRVYTDFSGASCATVLKHLMHVDVEKCTPFAENPLVPVPVAKYGSPLTFGFGCAPTQSAGEERTSPPSSPCLPALSRYLTCVQ